MTETIMVARWVCADHPHWVELHKHLDEDGCPVRFSYKTDRCSGPLAPVNPAVMDETAIRVMQARVNCGRYVPDVSTMPMERIV